MNSPECASDDGNVGARIYFDLDVEGQRHSNLCADIRQPTGSDVEQEFLVVPRPYGYSGPFNFPVFQGLVEFYYRHVVGAQGILIGGKATAMRFVGYVLEQEMRVQFEVP